MMMVETPLKRLPSFLFLASRLMGPRFMQQTKQIIGVFGRIPSALVVLFYCYEFVLSLALGDVAIKLRSRMPMHLLRLSPRQASDVNALSTTSRRIQLQAGFFGSLNR